MNPNRKSFLTGTSPDPGGPDERHLTPADIAHYDPRPAELSTPPASHGRGSRPCARATRSTEAAMMFLDCPAYLDQDGALRCGLPAEVRCRFTMRSTDGPVESAMIRCPAGHYFCGTIESLTWDSNDTHDPGSAAVTSRAARDSVQGSHDGSPGGGGSHSGDVGAEPERDACRPNTAPAYYLGRPAALWVTAMHPRRRRTASRDPMEVAVSGGNPIPDSGVLQHS
jgi:hypothetical protein